MKTPGVSLAIEKFFQLPAGVLQALEAGHIPTWVADGRVYIGLTVDMWNDLVCSFPTTADTQPRTLAARAGEA